MTFDPESRLRAFYCDHYVLPLPAGHRFPMEKYGRLRARVASELSGVILCEPRAATDAELGLAHAPEYVARVTRGELTPPEVRAIGFPWSPAMVERSRRSTGGTIGACEAALSDGVGVNLAGGTHHAMPAGGQGYCVFNDAAVAARLLQLRGRVHRVAVIDLDVHQGNGTAAIFADDPSVFTLSLHGAGNFPFRKVAGDLDIALPDGCGDSDFLEALDRGLAAVETRHRPDFLIYVAGADAHEGDRLGRLKLSTEGMAERDARVFAFARRLGLPIAVAMAGGYGHDVDVTVGVHLNTVRAALAHCQTVAAAGGNLAHRSVSHA